jgi:peptidyl-prolyl cis-trans isomerase B (cyclophilin B)
MKKLSLLLLSALFLTVGTVSQAGTDQKVKVDTTQGSFTIELFSDVPVTTKNFISLVSKGFYNGLTFHRYVPGFVIQGGDPTGTGQGSSDPTVPLEITDHKHVKGAVGLARANDPNSGSCQFYVCLEDLPSLDGNYCIFGQVIKGMNNVLKLRQGDKMTKVTLVGVSSSDAAVSETPVATQAPAAQ